MVGRQAIPVLVLCPGGPAQIANEAVIAHLFDVYADVRYNVYMPVPITKFRKDIFSFAEAALKGTVVEFTHKGVTFRVVPEQSTDKLANITPLEVINPAHGDDLGSGTAELRKEMTKEWEKDWSQL